MPATAVSEQLKCALRWSAPSDSTKGGDGSRRLALADPFIVCALVWKKPLRLCWPLLDALVPPDCGADLVRFAEGIMASGFCILLEPAGV